MFKNLAAIISLAVLFSGSFALSTQSVKAKTAEAKASEAKTSRNSSRGAKNYFVPPPPPYTPSMVFSALGMETSQAVMVDSDGAAVEKPVNSYSKYIFTRKQGDMPKVVQANTDAIYDPGVETKIIKQIDHIDSEISSIEKEIGKLLNL